MLNAGISSEIYARITWIKRYLLTVTFATSAIILSIDMVVLLFNIFYPLAIKPIYRIAMKIAGVLGYINTKLLLCIIFYLVFTPISLILKVFKKDLLDIKIDKNIDSYWVNRKTKSFNPEDYERLF